MIRFQAFSQNVPFENYNLDSSYLFGQDEIPVRGQLQLANGELIAVRHSDTAVGLATLWNIKQAGSVIIQTTRLPERDRPYNLNVELARGRLLRISQKRDEWGMADITLSAETHELVDQALEHFINAISQLNDPPAAAELADQSLAFSLKAGEAMALEHANLFLQRRAIAQGFGRHTLGCTVDPSRIRDNDYLRHIKTYFHFITIPMTWKDIEPTEQEPAFHLLDQWVAWASQNRIAIKVGPLLSFHPDALPDWLFIWENDFEQVREMAYEFVSRLVKRYGTRVQAWDVASGLNAYNCFKLNFEQLIEMTRTAALAAKRASNRSLVLIELAEPWGEYFAQNQRTIPPLIYADMVCQSGVNFDGFGVKIAFGRSSLGMWARDMLEYSHLLDRLAAYGKPLHLSSLQVPSAPDPRDQPHQQQNKAAFWHEGWSEATQALWTELAYRIALSKPSVETVTWRDMVDRSAELTPLLNGGLMNDDMTFKPAFGRLVQLRQVLAKTSRAKQQHAAQANNKTGPTGSTQQTG